MHLALVLSFLFLGRTFRETRPLLRVVFFVWIVALGKILTLNNLIKLQVIVMDWSCLCKKSLESIDHLLLHREVVRDLWVLVFRLFRIEWVMP